MAMRVEVEKIKAKGISLSKLLNPKLVKLLKDADIEADFAHLDMFIVEKDGESVQTHQVHFYHKNKDELENKHLHIDASRGKDLEQIKKVLEKLSKG